MVKILKEVKEAVCYFAGLMTPNISLSEIRESVFQIYKISLDEKAIQIILDSEKDLVADFKKKGSKALLKGIELNKMKYTSLHDRVLLIEEIIDKSVKGYDVDKVTSRGDVISYKAVSLNTALDAVKVLNGMMTKFETEEEDEDFYFRVITT